jgi:hypothetical protein
VTRRDSPLLHFLVVVRDLCQLRRGPQDLPYSPILFGLLVAVSVVLDLAMGGLIEGTSNVLARSLLSTTLILALCWTALSLRQFRNRYVQTASALVVCSIVFTLLILPVIYLAGPAPEAPHQLTPRQVLLGWAMLAIIVWNLAVNANILRHALEAPFALGMALATAWALADWALGHALFDAAG